MDKLNIKRIYCQKKRPVLEYKHVWLLHFNLHTSPAESGFSWENVTYRKSCISPSNQTGQRIPLVHIFCSWKQYQWCNQAKETDLFPNSNPALFPSMSFACSDTPGSAKQWTALSCPALPSPAQSCPVLSCPALPSPAQPCPALPCPALSCPALPSPALPCPSWAEVGVLEQGTHWNVQDMGYSWFVDTKAALHANKSVCWTKNLIQMPLVYTQLHNGLTWKRLDLF